MNNKISLSDYLNQKSSSLLVSDPPTSCDLQSNMIKEHCENIVYLESVSNIPTVKTCHENNDLEQGNTIVTNGLTKPNHKGEIKDDNNLRIIQMSLFIDEIKKENKKNFALFKQRLNNVEQKVASGNKKNMKKTNSSNDNTSEQLQNLRTELIDIFSKAVDEVVKANEAVISNQNSRLTAMESRLLVKKKSCISNEESVSLAKMNDMREKMLNVFSRSVQEMKTSNKNEFKDLRQQLNEIKQNSNILPAAETSSLVDHKKSLDEMRRVYEQKFATQKNRMHNIEDKLKKETQKSKLLEQRLRKLENGLSESSVQGILSTPVKLPTDEKPSLNTNLTTSDLRGSVMSLPSQNIKATSSNTGKKLSGAARKRRQKLTSESSRSLASLELTTDSLSSPSREEKVICSNRTTFENNEEFLSYLDKAQEYLRQINLGCSD